MKFTFETYRYLLDILTDDLTPSSFEDYSRKGKLFLRHDVDIYIENVPNMAIIENELVIKATYFFQPDSEFYNILSSETIKIISNLKEAGHHIGLHINPHSVKNKEQLIDLIHRMYDFYSNFIPLDRVISFHKPPDFVMESFEIEDFINVYGSKFFSDIRYFSDSKRKDFIDDLLKSFENDRETSIQLLIHPYWWDHIDLDLFEALQRFLEMKKRKIEFKISVEFAPYKDFMKVTWR